jgi:hypothetical protein
MANWVYTSVSVSGKAEDLKKFLEKAATERPYADGNTPTQIEYETHNGFSFWNFVQPPKEAVDSGEYFGTHGWKGGERVGNSKFNWYEWNIENWGTKWDAGDVSVETISDDSTSVSISFQTAWDVATPVFRAMVKQHPELEFSFSSEEEQGWGVEHESQDGELVETDSWDIPASHADYAKRDNQDGCRCSWEDDATEWYDDCPNKQEELSKAGLPNTHEEPNLIY